MNRMGIGLASILTLAIWSICVAQPSAAFEWPAHEFNTANNPNAAIETVFMTGSASQKPYFIALSEVCNTPGVHDVGNFYDTADAMEAVFAGQGYITLEANYYRMYASSSVCWDPVNQAYGAIGNLAYTRGVARPSHLITYSQSGPDVYDEGAVCVAAWTYLGDVAACSTHLYKGSGWIAQDQAEELRFVASAWFPGNKKVLMGDFNLRPAADPDGATPVPFAYYLNYYEVDQDHNRPTRTSGIKNDFIFGAKNAFSAFGSWPSISMSSYSDHYHYIGSFYS